MWPRTPRSRHPDKVLKQLRSLLEELPEPLHRQVFTHASWVERRADSYERLAFLGDSVLSLAISTHLYPRHADHGAGRLTKLRAQAVSGPACARVALELEVPARLEAAAPPGLQHSARLLAGTERVLASICEAIIGAAFIEWGFERVAPAVVEAFADHVEQAQLSPVDHKSALQENLARRGEVVVYRIEREDGPAHDRRFEVVAEVAGREVGRGHGRSKKSAEQQAALRALGDLA